MTTTTTALIPIEMFYTERHIDFDDGVSSERLLNEEFIASLKQAGIDRINIFYSEVNGENISASQLGNELKRRQQEKNEEIKNIQELLKGSSKPIRITSSIVENVSEESMREFYQKHSGGCDNEQALVFSRSSTYEYDSIEGNKTITFIKVPIFQDEDYLLQIFAAQYMYAHENFSGLLRNDHPEKLSAKLEKFNEDMLGAYKEIYDKLKEPTTPSDERTECVNQFGHLVDCIFKLNNAVLTGTKEDLNALKEKSDVVIGSPSPAMRKLAEDMRSIGRILCYTIVGIIPACYFFYKAWDISRTKEGLAKTTEELPDIIRRSRISTPSTTK